MFDFQMPVGSPVFAPMAESALVQRNSPTDVFARRERKASTLDRRVATKPSAEVHLEVGCGTVIFDCFGQSSMPVWVGPVFKSLLMRWGVGSGWDGHSAVPTNPMLVAQLLNCLESVLEKDGPAPTMTPLADGGMQAEWHGQGKNLEIVVSSESDPEYYFYDAATGREEEGSLEGSEAQVLGFLKEF